MIIETKLTEVTTVDSAEEVWIYYANQGKNLSLRDLENLKGPASGPHYDHWLPSVTTERKEERKFEIIKETKKP